MFNCYIGTYIYILFVVFLYVLSLCTNKKVTKILTKIIIICTQNPSKMFDRRIAARVMYIYIYLFYEYISI